MIAPSDGVPGLIVSAPSSSSGKTLISLGLLRCWLNAGLAVSSFKVGPDYIDSAFLSSASERRCINLDTWAMTEDSIRWWFHNLSNRSDLILGEGVMGLYDGAAGGGGATSDLAICLGIPIILVIDVRGQGASVAALVDGFRRFRSGINIVGVILNYVGSKRHEVILRNALDLIDVPTFGAIPQKVSLKLPSRHLGLVQASETRGLQKFMNNVADIILHHVDIEGIRKCMAPAGQCLETISPQVGLKPFGQRISVANDRAFTFCYESILEGWRQAGAEIKMFSPLLDEAPDTAADAIFLPGGYPELYAGKLASNRNFLDGLSRAANSGCWVYGECGGYMVLGEGIIDEKNCYHAMAGLLPLETSFSVPRLHLGYREAVLISDTPFGTQGSRFRGHEFHYSNVKDLRAKNALFRCSDSKGKDLGNFGAVLGKVFGSFVHLMHSH